MWRQKRRVQTAVGTHIGNVRQKNEDNYYYNGLILEENHNETIPIYEGEDTSPFQIYAICDGMGGGMFGEKASFMAVRLLVKYQKKIEEGAAISSTVLEYVEEANAMLYKIALQHHATIVGSTLALCCITKKEVFICNVGDSKIYQIHHKKITQVSQDHTETARLVKTGILTEAESKKHMGRNRLTQCLGINPNKIKISPFFIRIPWKKGDIYFLCSDGISEVIENEEIEAFLLQQKSNKEIIDDLIQLARRRGGKDNMTAMILQLRA